MRVTSADSTATGAATGAAKFKVKSSSSSLAMISHEAGAHGDRKKICGSGEVCEQVLICVHCQTVQTFGINPPASQ